jgi:hypothetical protein
MSSAVRDGTPWFPPKPTPDTSADWGTRWTSRFGLRWFGWLPRLIRTIDAVTIVVWVVFELRQAQQHRPEANAADSDNRPGVGSLTR